MANIDRPRGFAPAKSLIGGNWDHLIRFFPAANRSADTGNNHGDIYIGDPVTLVNGAVQTANSGDTILGVAVAIGNGGGITHGEPGYFNPDNLTQRYAPLADTTDVVIGVVPAELALFEVQSDSDLDLAQGGSADITTDAGEAHGNQITGFSTAEITTAVNNDVRVVELQTAPDNDPADANARYLVQFTTTAFTL